MSTQLLLLLLLLPSWLQHELMLRRWSY